MSTTRITIDLDDPESLPEGRVDYAVLDATTEEDIAAQQREDDAEAMRDCPRCTRPRVPNAETQEAMAEAEEMMRRGTARFASVEELLADLNEAGEE
ncbi:MAG: hypothetical protein F4Z72_04335 [Gemmatimonadales bacterium]|nr:hypothetical protein [Candidatus Palauibacter irciniicola]MYC17814.1 hypothetical protein [Gemmatimonadales bacterium]